MDQHFFENLPSEIVVEILSRLPTRAAMACKCVCKPWLGLLASPEFVNAHMSRSVPGIAVETHTNSYEVIEFVDEPGSDFDEEHRWNVAFNFELPFDEPMHSSANGLIFLSGADYEGLILCNPITCDYVKLPCPRQTSPKYWIGVETFGFGVSRLTGQYKVVRIFGELLRPEEYKNECQVYTVGTGSWRKVPFGSLDCSLRLYEDVGGVYLNGNLHWTVEKKTEGRWILCFDLETEVFSAFPAPTPLGIGFTFGKSLCVLRDRLCVSDLSIDESIVIWLMKEYEQRWTKEFIIPDLDPLDDFLHVWPIRVFENGDAFMESDDGKLFYYSNYSKTFDYDSVVVPVDRDPHTPTTTYASSFLSLKSFAMENVSSFEP